MPTIKIEHDNDAESPRKWDNMGTMIAFHGRYKLGDDGHGFNSKDYHGWGELEDAIFKQYGKDCILLSLYLYDHSGITMATNSFDCEWDSGQVGFIVASVNDIRESFGVKRITTNIRKRAYAALESEVKVYDDYLRGEVYGFTMTDAGGYMRDSCWGFYGSDPFTNGMSDHIPADMHDALRAAAA